MAEPAVEVVGLSKCFGERRALDGVGFSVAPGEMVALLGASGSGKSTLMRQIAGLQLADREGGGTVRVLGRTVQAGGRLAPDVRATRARVATIFQQFNLVDRLPVMTNVMAGALHRLPAWRWAAFPRPSVTGLTPRWPGWASRPVPGSAPPRSRAGSSSGRRSRARWCRAPK